RLAGYCRPEHCLFRSDGRMLLVGGSPRMEAHAQLPDVERELQFRRGLTQITNHINSAESIQQILISVKEGLVHLLDCERLTIYALDTKNQVLYSIQKVGTIPKEIRVPKSFESIAGYAALSRKTVNIRDAYDSIELGKLHPTLRFDQRWDKMSGFR